MTGNGHSSAPPGPWQGMIVYCAGMSWDRPTGTDKQMASRLVRYAPVLYVDPPESILHSIRQRRPRELFAPRLTQTGPRFARLTPLTPPGVSRPLTRRLARAVVRLSIRRAVRKLGADVEVIVVASLDDLLSSTEARQRVFYGTDDFVAGAELMGLDASWLEGEESRQLAAATRVIAVSPALQARWLPRHPAVSMIPNGCDTDVYVGEDVVLPDDVQLPEPIVGLVGHLSERLDMSVLEGIAAHGASLLLVGPITPALNVERFAALTARPNVTWVGSKPYDQLPRYLRLFKVGITPYVDDDFNRRSFPLKTLEYLAAGKAAVSTDLPATRWLGTPLIRSVSSPSEFVKAVLTLLAEPDTPELASRRRSFASQHSWDLRARQFAEVLNLDVDSA